MTPRAEVDVIKSGIVNAWCFIFCYSVQVEEVCVMGQYVCKSVYRQHNEEIADQVA